LLKEHITFELATERDQNEQVSQKLKLSDKIWIAAVIAVFVVLFVLIVIYDFI